MKNTILFYNTFSDGDMKNVFAVQGVIGDTFQQTYEEIKNQLESKEILDWVKKEFNVDQVMKDQTGSEYKFVGTEYDIEGLYYIFAPISTDGIDYEEDQVKFNFSERQHIKTF